MIFKQRFVENPYEKLVECIKRDLILNLQRKGIDIFKLDIDMKSDKVNVSLHIKEKQ
ncbi:MAG: hypothetical protein N3B21_06665 [Clostridia bacterium]|nr:hypothetical protein [Clostridia bacterium]